jgi:flagellar motor component MotA
MSQNVFNLHCFIANSSSGRRPRGAEQLGTYRLILEGIVAIVDGENPTLLRSRLDIFLQSDENVEKGRSLAPLLAQAR